MNVAGGTVSPLCRWKIHNKSISIYLSSVVGFFRGNTRRDIALEEDDLALINAYFANPASVLLLVKPSAKTRRHLRQPGAQSRINRRRRVSKLELWFPVIRTAERATLTVNDGDHTQDIDLDLGRLRAGKVAYSAKNQRGQTGKDSERHGSRIGASALKG